MDFRSPDASRGKAYNVPPERSVEKKLRYFPSIDQSVMVPVPGVSPIPGIMLGEEPGSLARSMAGGM